MSKTSKSSENLTTSQPLLTIETAAAKLGMSLSWMRQQKAIPFVRIGRRKLFRNEDLDKFIEQSYRSTTGS